MEYAPFVEAFIGVGAEVVALGLEQVRRQAFAAVAVVIGEGGVESWAGNEKVGRGGNDVSLGVLDLCDCLREVRGEQQVLEFRIGVERFLYVIEEDGADDAAATPE